jgi:hypothetical protein
MAEARNLPALTPKAALDAICEQFPNEAAILAAVVQKDIITLATDEVFALRDNNGEIRAFKQSLTLSSASGTLIQPVYNGPFVLSAQGYEVWQEAAGACVIFPSEVLVESHWQQNPAVIRDEKNGRILMIYARAVAFRFSSKGIPMVSDWTTIYDTPSYRMIDLLAKAKEFPQAFRLLPIEMKPDGDGTWAKYNFDEATCLWMNTSHNEALKWLSSIINREKKSIDFAQTFAKRNALKHLSGIQKAPGNSWTFPVISWRPVNGNVVKWDATQYAALQGRVGKMISGDRGEFEQIEMQAGAERISEEPGAAVMESEIDPEDQIDAALTKGDQTMTDEDKRLFANLAETKKQFPQEYNAACQAAGVEPDADINAEQASKVMAEVNRIIDKMAG